MRPIGISRGTMTTFRPSLRQTSTALRSRLSAYPLTIPATVFMLHGITIIPSVLNDPLETDAAILWLLCTTSASASTS